MTCRATAALQTSGRLTVTLLLSVALAAPVLAQPGYREIKQLSEGPLGERISQVLAVVGIAVLHDERRPWTR